MAPARPAARDPLDGPVVVRRPRPPHRADRRVRGRRETQESHRPGHGARPRPAAHARRRCTLPVPWVQLAGFARGLSGNVNAYLVALFALTWWASSRGRPWLAGSAAALAAALKLSPVVLLWWFVTQRSW